MSKLPKEIWVFPLPNGENGVWNITGKGEGTKVKYIHADLYETAIAERDKAVEDLREAREQICNNAKTIMHMHKRKMKMVEDIRKLREALGFYAYLNNYMAELKEKGFDFKHTAVHNDCGAKAREALSDTAGYGE